jgi:hypothetical protein
MTMKFAPFFNFAKERHNIYLRRVEQGLPAPWTKDVILHKYRFTNVFRELDNVTLWFAKNARHRYEGDPVATMMSTVVFRLFNRNTTGEAIFLQKTITGYSAFENFLDTGDAMVMYDPIRTFCGKGPYCTGSYIINSPNGMDKLTGVLTMIQWVWNRRMEFVDQIIQDRTLEKAWEQFRKIDHIADFTSYEIVTDLRWTDLLRNAADIMTWANPGPGAMRGLNRIHGRDLNKNQHKHLFVTEMREVLAASRVPELWPTYWPQLEMREVEHTLCEFDKYERARLGEGRPRGVYPHGK